MIVLEALEHQTIWGGTILKKEYGCKNDGIGHLYLVNGHKGMSNTILNGKYRGYTLEEAFPFIKEKLGLEKYEEFPLTVALVDATENLSVQVHPNDNVANILEGKKIGKEESWLFLKEPNEGYIYCGCSANNKEEISRAIESEKILGVVGRLPIKQNDYVCVKSGMLHAMSAGSFVYEIEYGSDYTYRFYDYHRKDKDGNERELHIEKALEAIEFVQNSEATGFKNDCWVSEENYEICRLTDRKSFDNIHNMMVIVSIIDGHVMCDGIQVKKGMSVILESGERIDDAELKDIIVSKLR